MSEERLTRRGFVAGAAATAAAAAVGTPEAEAAKKKATKKKKAKRKRRKHDVVVVGAGIAGLVAAREIMQAGHTVAVVEGRDRVGGRMYDRAIAGGEVVDLGAEFIGPTQNRIKALIDDLGIGTFPAYNQGKSVYLAGGQKLLYDDTGLTGIAPPDPLLLGDLAVVVGKLNSMAKEIPVDAPWKAKKAAEYDRQTLEQFLRSAGTGLKRFQDLGAIACRPIFGAEPRELSLLYTLFYIAASGDENNVGTFERNFNTRNGAQQDRIQGGTQSIAQAVAKQLGKRVILRSPVRRIVVTKGRGAHVDVISDRYVNRARQVIVALPPVLAGRIQYEPHLPNDRDQLTARFPQGNLVKIQAIYERPFWREAGQNGTSISDTGPCNVTFDSSPEDGTPGCLLGFIGGDEARRWVKLDAANRRGAALESFVRAFGPLARQPIDYIESDWGAEPYSRGCPVGVAPPGLLTSYGEALREPVGRLHWAGTESSTYWTGYMDGAVRSGERAAKEVLKKL